MIRNRVILIVISIIVVSAVSCSQVTNGNSTVSKPFAVPAASTTTTPATNDDVKIGDPDTSYMAIEFSPDMRYMMWIEPRGDISLLTNSGGGENRVWLCTMDVASGEMVPRSGKGFKIAAISNFGGSPQWGTNDQGVYAGMVDREGYIVIIRPAQNAGDGVTATIERLPTQPNLSRMFAYPSRITGPGGLIMYIQKDTHGEPQLFYIDLDHPRNEYQITRGPVPKFSKAQIPAFLVDVQRWFYDVETLAGGLPIVVFGDADTGKNPPLIKIMQLDLSGSTTEPVTVAVPMPVLFDPFPFLYGNERYIIAGLNFTSSGAVFKRDENGQYRTILNRIVPDNSTLQQPNNFASAEPFIWKGKVYSAFQINEPGFPGTSAAEIWLASVFDNSVMRKISANTVSPRADPEFFLGRDSVWIFYYSPAGGNRWELHRAGTGLH